MSEAWMAAAACRGLTELFFPARGDWSGVEAARQVCNECPVWRECLDYSMTPDAPPDGVLAGLSGRDRRHLRRDCGTMPVEVAAPWRPTPTGRFPWLPNGQEPPLHAWTRTELLEVRAALNGP